MITSHYGGLTFVIHDESVQNVEHSFWYWNRQRVTRAMIDADRNYWLNPNIRMFEFYTEPTNFVLRFPHGLLVIAFAWFATIPRVRWQFSLRTLLVATTLVAVVLGLIVWAGQ